MSKDRLHRRSHDRCHFGGLFVDAEGLRKFKMNNFSCREHKGRIISLSIALIYIIFAFFVGNFLILLDILFPLACIWFGDELGRYTALWGLRPFRQTPGYFVKFVGWILLLVPAIGIVYNEFSIHK